MPEDFLEGFDQEAIEQLRHNNLLKALIRCKIIEASVKSVKLDESLVDQRWDLYIKQNGIKSDEELEIHLKRNGLNKKSLRWQIELPVRIGLLCKENFSHKAEARFLLKKEKLDKVTYSLLRVKDRHIAQELYLRIAGDEASFADTAAKFSQGPEAKTNGIVGPAPLSSAHPILSEHLRTIQPGQLQEPIFVDGWWIVIRLEAYQAARFEEATAKTMAQELFQEWVEEEVLCKLEQI